MHILVTGSDGYIGTHLVKNLLISGHSVDTLDKKKDGSAIFKLDITKEISSIPKEYDCIVHLAAKARVGESVQDPISYYETNTLGTLNVLRNLNCKRFVFASTGQAIHMGNPYSISKKAAEEIVSQYCITHNIPYTTFRFFNVIGSDGVMPTNPDALFFKLKEAAATGKFFVYGNTYNTPDGTCLRDYVHVNEICSALQEATTYSTNQIEHLGHGKGYSVLEIANIFKRVNNVDFKIVIDYPRPGDIVSSVLDKPSLFMQSLYPIDELLKLPK